MTSTTTTRSPYASPVDLERHGIYRVPQHPDDPRPLYRFTGRLTRDGSSGYPAVPGRYHLYIARACPWAHRAMIFRAMARLRWSFTATTVSTRRMGDP